MAAVGGIEIACRLVGKQNRRIVGQRARDRDPLLLAARQLGRIVVAAIVKPTSRNSAAAFSAASDSPAISSGTSTFSNAVSAGIR